MTAADDLTWDIALADGGARRGSLADMGGAENEDEAPFPDETTMPSARKANQTARQLAALNAVVPSVVVSVQFNAGDPEVVAVVAPGTNITVSSFTVTDNADGDTTLSWTAGDLPVGTGVQPVVCSNVLTDPVTIAAQAAVNSVRVVTWIAGVLADADFTLEIR